MLAVFYIHVQVVLEVLKHVHVLLHELVAAHSGEGECLVVELPGVHLQTTIVALVLCQVLVNKERMLEFDYVKAP